MAATPDGDLADTFMIARMTHRAPGTVRSWASRGMLTRKGTGPRGRALYDMDEAEALAVRLDSQLASVQHQKRTAGMPKISPARH